MKRDYKIDQPAPLPYREWAAEQLREEQGRHLKRLASAAEKQGAIVTWLEDVFPIVNGEDLRDIVSFDRACSEMAIGDAAGPVSYHIRARGIFDYAGAARRVLSYIGRLHVVEETIRAEFLAALDTAVEKLNASLAAAGGEEARQVRNWRVRVERYLDQAMAAEVGTGKARAKAK